MPFFFKPNAYFLPEAKAQRAAQAQQQKQLAEERVKADEEAFKAAKVRSPLVLFLFSPSFLCKGICFWMRICVCPHTRC